LNYFALYGVISRVLASESWLKELPSIRSLAVDRGRMRSVGDYLLWLKVSPCTWLDDLRASYPTCKKPVPLIPKVFFQNKWRKNTERNQA